MTETQNQGPEKAPPAGWNTEHLKDYRGLRRARVERKIAGVCGGLARHLDIDPTIVRVVFVVLAVFGGAGLLLYGVLWVLVPEEGSERTLLRTSESTRNVLLVAAAVVALLIAVGDSMRGFHFPWLLVAAGILVLVMVTRERRSSGPPPGPPTATQQLWEPGSSATAPPGQGVPPAPPTTGDWYYAPAPVPPRPPKTGPLWFGPTLALLALGLGILGLYDASGGSVADAAYPALAVAIVGVMLLVGAFVGRPGGLVLLGLLSSVALLATAIGGPGYDGPRDLVLRPTTGEHLQDSYDVPAGRIELDLTRMSDLEALDGRTIHLRGNAGEIVVYAPKGLDVSYDAQVHVGGLVETPHVTRNGWGPRVVSHLDSSRGDNPQLDLDLDLQFGHLEVMQR
jgi:phage shock protein PspC (stress-responsive transcriptional regulator)